MKGAKGKTQRSFFLSCRKTEILARIMVPAGTKERLWKEKKTADLGEGRGVVALSSGKRESRNGDAKKAFTVRA